MKTCPKEQFNVEQAMDHMVDNGAVPQGVYVGDDVTTIVEQLKDVPGLENSTFKDQADMYLAFTHDSGSAAFVEFVQGCAEFGFVVTNEYYKIILKALGIDI